MTDDYAEIVSPDSGGMMLVRPEPRMAGVRDRYLEQINTKGLPPGVGDVGKYDVSRPRPRKFDPRKFEAGDAGSGRAQETPLLEDGGLSDTMAA